MGQESVFQAEGREQVECEPRLWSCSCPGTDRGQQRWRGDLPGGARQAQWLHSLGCGCRILGPRGHPCACGSSEPAPQGPAFTASPPLPPRSQ